VSVSLDGGNGFKILKNQTLPIQIVLLHIGTKVNIVFDMKIFFFTAKT